MLSAEQEKWARDASGHFQSAFGLSGRFAISAARLFIALHFAGLAPRISRGWSDPAHQKELQARWDRGDHSGLRVRPATTSKHSVTSWLGRPAAEAVDMPSRDDRRAAAIAQSLGIGTGLSFTTEDPGHYYLLGGAK